MDLIIGNGEVWEKRILFQVKDNDNNNVKQRTVGERFESLELSGVIDVSIDGDDCVIVTVEPRINKSHLIQAYNKQYGN